MVCIYQGKSCVDFHTSFGVTELGPSILGQAQWNRRGADDFHEPGTERTIPMVFYLNFANQVKEQPPKDGWIKSFTGMRELRDTDGAQTDSRFNSSLF